MQIKNLISLIFNYCGDDTKIVFADCDRFALNDLESKYTSEVLKVFYSKKSNTLILNNNKNKLVNTTGHLDSFYISKYNTEYNVDDFKLIYQEE